MKKDFNVLDYTPEQIGHMREWLKDLTFADIDGCDMEEFVDGLEDIAVIKATNRHCEGGIQEFLELIKPLPVKA